VPDSLIGSFKTLINNRPVQDGKGINPDIFTEDENMGMITVTLMRRLHIFNYATKYYLSHPTIATPKKFELNDTEYSAFIDFLKYKEYKYSTQSETILKELKKVAESEKYFTDAEKEYAALLKKLTPDNKSDLLKFKTEIKLILENEIISRYYYQNGRIEQSLNTDPDVRQAIELLKNKKKYNEILTGTFVSNK
jgi:carboxyl-terminal processing protease